ncbi:MAG: efflux RND transporter permease subunit [Lachnospiraceae bacterium]|jgi:multidrug efflux pump subunit AcrB|nr:efflux RND transporter permease subunit [Lachnospiraceae bacterium]
MGLTRLSLKRPVSTLLLVLALAVFGFSSLLSLRLELMPDMDMPIMMVMTIYPGADPESVEALVSGEIEGQVASLSGVDSVMSYSQENMSMVLLQYDYSVDTNDAYLDLRAALDITAASLPEECQEPMVLQMDINAMPSIMYSVSTTDGTDAFSVVNDTIVPELEAVSTVADVEVTGGREHYIRILLDEEALNQYGLSMNQIAQSIAATDFTIPLGSLEQGSQSISAISTSENQTVQELQRIPLFTSVGSMIQLSDVAQVGWSQKDPDSISRFNGEDTISVSVTKNQTAGTIGMVNDVKKVMNRMLEQNSNLMMDISMDMSEQILEAVGSVASTLLMGVILSMIILFLFFGDWKASLIVGSSMPISLLVTVIVMAVAGFSLNMITLGALVIAIGMMVDSSIVVLESCFRSKDRMPDFKEASLQGARGVVGSIIASTITTIVVYLPLCLQEGLTGQIFGQLGYTIIFAMLASLISAMTLVPLFFSLFKPKEKKELKINSVLEGMRNGYDVFERKLLKKKKTCVLLAVVLLVLSFVLARFMDTVLMPSMDEGMVSISATFRSGTKVSEVDERMQRLEDMVTSHEDVENYTLTIQKGSASITANLKDDRKMTSQEVADQWIAETSDIVDAQLEIQVSSQMSAMMTTGAAASITLESTDLDDMKEAVNLLEDSIWSIPGVLNVSNSAGETATQIRVVVDPLDAMSHGMTPVQVAGALYSMISGTEAMTVTSDGEEYSVYLEFPEGTCDDASRLLGASISGVPLSEMASLQYTDSQQTIMKTDGKYTLTVNATCLSDDQMGIQEQMEELAEQTSLPNTVELAQNSMDEMMVESFTALGWAIAAAMFLVFLVMAMQFESPKYSLMVMLSIPFSLIGSLGLLFITGEPISMTSLMGILMLVGIVVNNGILYVDGVNELRMRMPVEDALIRSGQTRLRPILMTTLTTVISMIPMAMGIGSGTEMMSGMAIIIIGGLVASTLLILVLMPVFYLLVYGRSKKERRERRKKYCFWKKEKTEDEEFRL